MGMLKTNCDAQGVKVYMQEYIEVDRLIVYENGITVRIICGWTRIFSVIRQKKYSFLSEKGLNTTVHSISNKITVNANIFLYTVCHIWGNQNTSGGASPKMKHLSNECLICSAV